MNEVSYKFGNMRFMSIDELFIKKGYIKDRFSELSMDDKEIYKWYFFYQLCFIKNPLKKLAWEYVCGINVLDELNEQYIEFCNKREKNKN